MESLIFYEDIEILLEGYSVSYESRRILVIDSVIKK